MEHLKRVKRLYGLIGYPLSHSFSKKYFSQKFEQEKIKDCFYELFPLSSIEALPELIAQYPNLIGLNVTIPYKEQVAVYLDELDAGAGAVGAVNTIKIEADRRMGFNTDVYGFRGSLQNFLNRNDQPYDDLQALILGTGGSAKAVGFVLDNLKIPFKFVSRSKSRGHLDYAALGSSLIQEHLLIINTTPLGMSPNESVCPEIPYNALTPAHLLFDLVYNPKKTLFLKRGQEEGAKIQNGLEMLHLQAEGSWRIWNDD